MKRRSRSKRDGGTGTETGAWLDRAAALARLRVRAQTLYAYASRGRIGVRPDPVDPRRSLYSAADVDALVARRARGRRRAAIAESTVQWGEPVIATTISTVFRGRLIYRGRDAVELASSATLEQVAGLLWNAEGPVELVAPRPVGSSGKDGRRAAFRALGTLAAERLPTLGRPLPMLRADAAEATAVLAATFGAPDARRAGPSAPPIHERLARGWALRAPAADAVRRALVLLADHELNASAFAARVAASTGASIGASLLAGLAALSGPRHGGAAEAVSALVEDAERLGAAAAVGRWLARNAPLPGFDHPLYPDGDPRARALLDALEPDDGLAAVVAAAARATGGKPNVDCALVALVRAHDLPADAPFRLFAIGRSVGWAAHAIEQATSGSLIRPRARYQGPMPDD